LRKEKEERPRDENEEIRVKRMEKLIIIKAVTGNVLRREPNTQGL
jgi:hypothetical protein